MIEDKPEPKLSELMLAGPESAVEPNDKEVAREDQLQAFQDFSNEALPMTERMDALAFFVDLTREGGATYRDDEDESGEY